VADTDLSAEFEKISDKAKAATDELKSAGHRTRDQLDAEQAAMDADMAEAYALDSIDFVATTIQAAEYVALDAIYLRANAAALNS
jgi:hypothetical protein